MSTVPGARDGYLSDHAGKTFLSYDPTDTDIYIHVYESITSKKDPVASRLHARFSGAVETHVNILPEHIAQDFASRCTWAA